MLQLFLHTAIVNVGNNYSDLKQVWDEGETFSLTESGDSAELRWDDFPFPESVSAVSIMALPCFVFFLLPIYFHNRHFHIFFTMITIVKLSLPLKNRIAKMCFLSIYLAQGVISHGAVDTNKLKRKRTVLKGEERSVCVRACVPAVQMFPAVFLHYSRQRMMEISQLERRPLHHSDLVTSQQKKTHSYKLSKCSLCNLSEEKSEV